jgi:hypothetical protein
VKAKADSGNNAEVIGIVSAVADANNFTLLASGHVTGLSGLTSGNVYYLSDATAGLLTTTEPTAVGSVSKPLLIADATTSGWFYDWRGKIIPTPVTDGGQIDYVERTTDLTAGGETDWIVGNPVTYDGATRIRIEMFASAVDLDSTGGVVFRLYDGVTVINRLADVRGSAFGQDAIAYGSCFLTPSAGSHTYKITATLAGTGTQVVHAGAAGGGAGTYVPAFMRISNSVASGSGVSGTAGWVGAQETWTYSSVDGPTGVFTAPGDLTGTYSPGMRIKLTQTTVKYFIVTAVAFSSGTTTITVYGGTDYTLANAAITSPFYSTAKVPAGFNANPAKWTESYSSSADIRQSSPVQNIWYNGGPAKLDIPIGAWNVRYSGCFSFNVSGGSYGESTLSTANNSQSDSSWTVAPYIDGVSNANIPVDKAGNIAVSSKTTHYLNARVIDAGAGSVGYYGVAQPTIIRAVCAYL